MVDLIVELVETLDEKREWTMELTLPLEVLTDSCWRREDHGYEKKTTEESLLPI